MGTGYKGRIGVYELLIINRKIKNAISKGMTDLEIEDIAIGDGMNDLEMLEEAGISVAMGNSVKEVFEVSKYATNKYEDNGTEIVLDWIIRGLS